MSQQFCLKWNNHMNNMMDVFKNLLSTEAMVDVTLACDGLSLKAHKIVLSACSPFFQSLFLENPCKHPIVILKDMKYTELKAIIEFMYHGEVNVAQDQLSALMKTAETLRVKGLAEVTNEKNQSGDESSRKSVSRSGTPPPKRKKGRTRKRSVSDQSDDGVPELKTEQPDSDIEELSSDMDHNTPYSSATTVPLQSRSNSHKPQVQQQPGETGFASDENYNIEAPKLLQQTITADDLPSRSGRSSVQSNMELMRRPQSSIDHSSASVPITSTPMSTNALVACQQPESPPDIKPNILDLEPPSSPAAGPSHITDENSMMFMDQSNMSISGPSCFQDDSSMALVPSDSQPQGLMLKKLRELKWATKEDTNAYLCSDCKGDASSVVTIQDDSGNIPDEEITSQLIDQTSDHNNGEGTSDQIELNTGNSSGENIGSSSVEEDTTVNSLDEVFKVKLTPKERLMVRYLLGIIKKDFTTGPVNINTLTYLADTANNDTSKTIMKNLCNKHVIRSHYRKSGNGGFCIYTFSSENSYVKNIVEKLSESEDNYEYRDEVALLSGQKQKLICYLVSIAKNTTTGPISIEVLARVADASKLTVNNSVIQKLISKKGAYFIKINDQEPKKHGYKNFILNQNLIDSVKILFPFYTDLNCSS